MFRDGGGEEHLDEGKKVLDKMKAWSKCSDTNFNNKLLLLEAEYHASMCDIKAAKVAFEASVRSARDHGLVQEQGEQPPVYDSLARYAFTYFRILHAMHSKVLHASSTGSSCLPSLRPMRPFVGWNALTRVTSSGVRWPRQSG